MMNFNIHDIVTERYVLNDSDEDLNEKCLNIVYGSDENYQFGAGVSAVSLLINNPSTSFRFHFFLDAINPNFVDKLKWIAEQFSTKIIVYKLNHDFLEKLPACDVWSSAMYFRLIALDYLAFHYDYALYLDADVVCHSELNLDANILSQVICGVVLDSEMVRSKSGSRLGVPELSTRYFNSGVMFINLKKWQEYEVTKRCLALLSAPDAKQRYKYPDQDVLNLILVDNQVQLNQRFNTIYTLKNELYDRSHKKYQQVITDNTTLIHYTGITKPWHTWANYPSAKPFYIALEQSPWCKNDLKSASKFVERKKEYKHLLKQKKIVAGCLCGIQYLLMKVFRNKK